MIDKRYVILLFAYGNFWSAVCISLQAPFFPREAEKKGASASEYGLVFGIYELGIIVLSPLFSKLTGRVRIEAMISLGLLIVGAAVVSFGFLDRAPNGKPFVALALAIRLVEAIGCILFNVFNFTAVAALYPDSIASSFSILQTGYGVGLLAGPTIGALLYDAGGFTLPFVALGSFLLLGALLSFVMLPSTRKALDQNCDEDGAGTGGQSRHRSKLTRLPQAEAKASEFGERAKGDRARDELSAWSLVCNVSCLLDLAAIVSTFSFIGFNAVALEPHLRQFELGVVVVGLLFIIDGGVFAAISPLIGACCDRGAPPKLLILAGHLVSVLGVSLIGPLAIIPLESSLPLVVCALALIGLGVGLKFVPAFFNTLHEAIDKRAFPDDKRTYALVTSVAYSSGSLGSFLGPSIGGYLFDHFGYRPSSCVFLLGELCLFLTALCYYLLNKARGSPRAALKASLGADLESCDERRRLLPPNVGASSNARRERPQLTSGKPALLYSSSFDGSSHAAGGARMQSSGRSLRLKR